MRYYSSLAAILIGLASPTFAQDKVWTPAPIPSISAGDTVMPAARAGELLVDDTTPFSGLPTGSVTTNGATSANQYNGVSTPRLSK